MPRNCVDNMGWVKFWLEPLNLWPHPFFYPKMPKIEQKVILFFIWKGEEIRPWFCNFWIGRWLNFLLTNPYFFRFGPPSWGKWASKLGKSSKKIQILVMCSFCKNWNFPKPFSTPLLKHYLWCKFQQDWTIFGGIRAPKPPKWPNSWMLHRHKNIWKFITWEPQMLWR